MLNIKNSLAAVLSRIGITANFVTLLGLFTAGASGTLIYVGEFFWGGAVLLLAGGLDLMDGAIARASGKDSKFGGVLDSSLDRYGDFFVWAGLLLYCIEIGDILYAALIISAIAGSFEISYIRARAECVVPKCKVGFWERGERLVLLSVALILDNPEMAIWILAIGTHVTALYRLAHARALLKPQAKSEPRKGFLASVFFHSGGRTAPLYLAKCAGWILLLLLIRPSF